MSNKYINDVLMSNKYINGFATLHISLQMFFLQKTFISGGFLLLRVWASLGGNRWWAS
jgi:hypothetical protein